jgi:two-component sensor histidine kinase
MPRMDGFQLCRECKNNHTLRKVPFVFYTATYTDKKDEEFALSLGAEKFLIKPLEPDEFMKILRAFIEEYKDVMPAVPQTPMKDEEAFLSEYNERLVRKLEKKVLDLEKENKMRKQAEEQALTSLGEKELLIREIYHRTRNNMQIICALLNLQSEYSKDERMLKLFKETENRIKSMALVHGKLYESKDLSRINLKSYIEDITESLFKTNQTNPEKVLVKIKADDVSLAIDSAIPCGLVINEIIVNSLKYAFPDDKKGEIRIELCLSGKGEIVLRVADNGVGMPKGFDPRNTKSLGLQIIYSLAEEQLKGKVELNLEKGVEYQIRFSVPDRPERV